jgi:hypothetical protein
MKEDVTGDWRNIMPNLIICRYKYPYFHIYSSFYITFSQGEECYLNELHISVFKTRLSIIRVSALTPVSWNSINMSLKSYI